MCRKKGYLSRRTHPLKMFDLRLEAQHDLSKHVLSQGAYVRPRDACWGTFCTSILVVIIKMGSWGWEGADRNNTIAMGDSQFHLPPQKVMTIKNK